MVGAQGLRTSAAPGCWVRHSSSTMTFISASGGASIRAASTASSGSAVSSIPATVSTNTQRYSSRASSRPAGSPAALSHIAA